MTLSPSDAEKLVERDTLRYLQEQIAAAARGNAGLIVLSVARAKQFIAALSSLAEARETIARYEKAHD